MVRTRLIRAPRLALAQPARRPILHGPTHPGDADAPGPERQEPPYEPVEYPPGEPPPEPVPRRGEPPQPSPKRCGPDVSDWFFEELILHWNYSVTQYDSHGFFRFHSFSSYTDFAKYANSLDYKFMQFPGKDCPIECAETVTLCGKCIHRSELGNLMFGITGRVWGFYYYQLQLGTWIKGAGLAEDWDRAAAEIGYDTANGSATALTASAASMCSTFQAHPRWANIQAPEAKDCPTCAEVFAGPHSTPGLPCAFPGVVKGG